MTKMFVLLIMFGFLTAATSPAAENTATPILVELFTSEGCSSCPPADAWLQRIDSAQPLPNAHLIVLGEHVDYWDHDGWKDPYSSPLVTERQRNYVSALHLQTPYTPQIIVDGVSELRLNDERQMEQVFQQALQSATIPIRIVSASIDSANPNLLHAHIETGQNSADHDAEVYAAIALSRADSQVLRGENSGRHLTHVSVLESITKVGKLEKSKVLNKDVEIKLKPGTDPKNIRLIVFAQEPGPGKVLGASLQEGIHE